MPLQTQIERFETLLRGHVDALYRTALRFSDHPATAEDLVQETSLRAYRAFVAGTEPDNFRAWVFRILVNLCIDHSRRKAVGTPHLTVAQEVDDLPCLGKDPAQSFANARLGRDLAAAVDALPGELRLLVQLVLVEGMNYREAAECVGCPEGTVRSRLNRARGLLRDRLADHAPEGHAPDGGTKRIVRFPDARGRK